MLRYLGYISLFLPLFIFGGSAALLSPLLDDERLVSWGLDLQHFEVGLVGNGEVSHRVRITAMNGILNHKNDCLNVMEVISRAHGGVNVHYAYWNSEGWTEDMFKGLFAKMGFVSQPACELANLWKGLILEMGGTASDGVILHFAHSIAATETQAASVLLTPEEKRMIHIVALGPATIIHPFGFGSVMNYISKRDAIVFLDPYHFIRAIRGDYPHVTFIGDFTEFATEHALFEGGSYRKVIEDYGRAFQENYLE